MASRDHVIILIIALVGIAFGQWTIGDSDPDTTTWIDSTTAKETTTEATSTTTKSTPSTSTSTTPQPTTTPIWTDPFAGNKAGKPGARAYLCKKSLDSVHEFASDMISKAILAMSVVDVSATLGPGTLTVKPPRVTEATIGKVDYQMVPPNRVRSVFSEGRIVAGGIWMYKPFSGDMFGGEYSARIDGATINSTSQLGRTADARPSIQPVECKSNISNFKIDIQGSDQVHSIENCVLPACLTIREFFERNICDLFDAFVKEVINRELQLVPNRVCIDGDYKVEYGLLSGEPTVNDTEQCIRAGLEGKYNWRGLSGVPFNAPEMEWTNRGRVYSFQISDYTFNTLLHQAHSSGYRFSAAELSSSSKLALNCGDIAVESTQTPTTNPARITYSNRRLKPKRLRFRNGMQVPKCLGALLANFSNVGPYSAEDKGDIVFKTSQKASAIYLGSEKRALFNGGGGSLEFMGPVGSGGNRAVLARAEVRLMQGLFMPKLSKANITGSVKIITIQLVQSMSSFRSATPEWLEAASRFVAPILSDMINGFFSRFAQFPTNLPDKYECKAPELSILPRTMQIDCDVGLAGKGGNGGNGDHSQSHESGESDESECTCFRNTCVCPTQSPKLRW